MCYMLLSWTTDQPTDRPTALGTYSNSNDNDLLRHVEGMVVFLLVYTWYRKWPVSKLLDGLVHTQPLPNQSLVVAEHNTPNLLLKFMHCGLHILPLIHLNLTLLMWFFVKPLELTVQNYSTYQLKLANYYHKKLLYHTIQEVIQPVVRPTINYSLYLLQLTKVASIFKKWS